MKIYENKFDKNFWLATFSLVGTTIGAGIFSLPYAFAKTGFIIGFIEFTVLVGVVLLIQQMLGEITLRAEDKKRLAGLTADCLGSLWGGLVMVSVLLGGAGTLLIYVILGGDFLSLITGLNIFWSSMIFFTFWFMAILIRPRNFGRMEFYVSFSVIFIIILIAIFNFGSVNFNNFREFNIKNFLIPYGVILFAMTGYTVIPKMEDLLGANKHKLKKAIKYGTLIPAVVYLLFVFIVLGVSGKLTSPDAIFGFSQTLNSNFIMYAGALLGLLAVAGAALSYGIYFRETLWYDLKLNKNLAWLITGIIPFFLFIFGVRDVVPVMDIVGALFFGFQAFVILLIYKKIRQSKNILYYVAGSIMLFGAALEIWLNF